MQRFINYSRLAFICAVMAVIIVIYGAKLYALQVYDDGVDDEIAHSTSQTETLTAARGDILDRNGVLLVSSVASYDILLSRSDLLAEEDTNGAILKYIYTAVENGVPYIDTLPVTNAAPFNYVAEMSQAQAIRLDSYFEYFNIDKDISASDFIAWLKDHYSLDYSVNISDARLIIGIRFELECRVIMNIDPYVFAENAGTEFISLLYEQGFDDFTVETRVERKYYTDAAAHLLGYIGAMDPEQYKIYGELGYPMNAEVGQSGIEQAFEEYLHGTDGKQRVITGQSGAVLDVEVTKQPEPGSNVYTSIDIGMQEVAEKSLAETIAQLNSTRSESDQADGGAVVAVQVGTGEVLTCATFPTYNIETYFEDYTTLEADSTSPLLNRATAGIYNPGSTFKPVMAYAGLTTGTITENTTVFDGGRYTAYSTYQPYCWIYGTTGGGHGYLNVVGALENSCNVFFWWLGDHMGLDAITTAARAFGLDQKTGIETGEALGYVPTVDKKKELSGEDWYAADTLIASIGQGYNMYTPVQLASYISTIATGGTRYKLTLLHTVKDAGYNEVIEEAQHTILDTMPHPEYIEIIQRGLKAVASTGTAASEFRNFKVAVACKTGTVQSDTEASNTGVFICYAPADNPEIAVSVVIEKGTSGATVLQVAKKVLEYYFGEEIDTSIIAAGTLVP